MPATLTRISTWPTCSAQLRIDSRSQKSSLMQLADRPDSLSACACFSKAASLRAANTVRAPASAINFAIAKPIPRLAPATNARLPVSEKGVNNL